MTRVTHFRVAIASTAMLCAAVLAAPAIRAQSRFQIESRDVLSQSSLVIYTIRDSQLSTCYTLFVVEPPPAPEPPANESTASSNVEKARAARDEQLAALRVRVDARAPSDRVTHAIDDQAAAKKIEDEFDHAILGVPMMNTLPWAVPLPGMQTSGTQYQAESMRRASVDPTTGRAAAEDSHRLEQVLIQAAQAP
ncbi:MAG: hypothetical protein ABUS56_04250, partial [Acidobacteriota bacterium]